MTYEEWLEDVRRVEAQRRIAGAVAWARAVPPPPPPPQNTSYEVFLCARGRRQRPQWPRASPQGLLKKPLRVQMLKVQHKQRMMPALLEMPPANQVSDVMGSMTMLERVLNWLLKRMLLQLLVDVKMVLFFIRYGQFRKRTHAKEIMFVCLFILRNFRPFV